MKQLLLPINQGMGYKAISKQFGVHYSVVRKIIHMWKTLKTFANYPWIGKFTPLADCEILR